jgi:hypothetical protein
MSNMHHAALKAPPRAKPPAPPRTPEREQLHAAIQRRTEAEQALEVGKRAVTRVVDAMEAAERRVEAARAEVAKAGDRDANALADAVAGGEPATTNATRKARTALEVAEDELNAATTARAKLRARLGDAEDALLVAQNHVARHVDIVLRAGAAQVLADAQRAASRLRELLPMLQFFVSSSPRTSPGNWEYEVRTMGRERANRRMYVGARDGSIPGQDPFAELATAIEKFVKGPLDGDKAWSDHPVLAGWHAAREALHHDADAPLPALPV